MTAPDSKAPRDDAQPLIVYHGTQASFSAFRTPAWFTPRRDFAECFAGDWGVDGSLDARSRVITARLRLENPLPTSEWGVTEGLAYDPQWREEQERAGYDGVRFESEDGEVEYIAFHPHQIEILSIERVPLPRTPNRLRQCPSFVDGGPSL